MDQFIFCEIIPALRFVYRLHDYTLKLNVRLFVSQFFRFASTQIEKIAVTEERFGIRAPVFEEKCIYILFKFIEPVAPEASSFQQRFIVAFQKADVHFFSLLILKITG